MKFEQSIQICIGFLLCPFFFFIYCLVGSELIIFCHRHKKFFGVILFNILLFHIFF